MSQYILSHFILILLKDFLINLLRIFNLLFADSHQHNHQNNSSDHHHFQTTFQFSETAPHFWNWIFPAFFYFLSSEFHLIFRSRIRELWSLGFTEFHPTFVQNFLSGNFLASSKIILVMYVKKRLQKIDKSNTLFSVLIVVSLILVLTPLHNSLIFTIINPFNLTI